MFDAGILGSAYGGGCLPELGGTFFPTIGDQKDAMGAFECSFEGRWPIGDSKIASSPASTLSGTRIRPVLVAT